MTHQMYIVALFLLELNCQVEILYLTTELQLVHQQENMVDSKFTTHREVVILRHFIIAIAQGIYILNV